MNAELARKNKRKKYLNLRKNKAWFTVPLYLLLGIVIVLLTVAFILASISSVMSNKIKSEYETVLLLAELYDSDQETDKAQGVNMLHAAGRPYLIRSTDGTVLHTEGEVTNAAKGGPCSLNVGFSFMSFQEEVTDCYVYPDAENQWLKFNEKNELEISLSEYLSKEADIDALENMEINTDLSGLPFWIEVPVGDGAEKLLCRAVLQVNGNDVVLITVVALSLGLLLVLLFCIMLGSIISGARNQHRITKLFFSDMVTKGHNWMWFIQKGGRILQKKLRSSYAVVDAELVRYRTFCVCQSLEEGERLLGDAQQFLLARTDSKKELCAHNSEGYFALLLRYTDESELRRRIELLLADAAKVQNGRSFTFHIGVDLIPQQTETGKRRKNEIDIEREYSNACAARASLEGTDDAAAAYFDEQMVEEQKWIDTVQTMQQTALTQEEFVVYYQPKYDPRTNQLRGAEALIRWQSPEHGFISPGRFIPIFERNGFITEIDHYMLSHAAKDQRRWLDEGYHCVPVSVNVSRAHFIESDLAEQIRDIVDAAGTPHALIEIELTESAFFDDKKALVRTISRLKEYGFTVSMDDFGSGYSSLNSLKDMPLDVLKLDAEFFRGEEAGTSRGEIVVTEAIRLAKSLNMRTVAEGIEVREQVDFLAEQGCDMIQGYYFAKPMPGADYEERMKASAGQQQESGTE